MPMPMQKKRKSMTALRDANRKAMQKKLVLRLNLKNLLATSVKTQISGSSKRTKKAVSAQVASLQRNVLRDKQRRMRLEMVTEDSWEPWMTSKSISSLPTEWCSVCLLSMRNYVLRKRATPTESSTRFDPLNFLI